MNPSYSCMVVGAKYSVVNYDVDDYSVCIHRVAR